MKNIYISSGNLTGINKFIGNNDYHQKFSNGIFLLNKNELRLLRNTIYAEHGYIFNSSDLKRHFSQFTWYHGTKINVEAELTESEKKIIELIARIEVWYPKSEYENLIGYWINTDTISYESIENEIGFDKASFWIFYPNGTFHFFYKNIGEVYGVWSQDNINRDLLYLGYLVDDDDYTKLTLEYFYSKWVKFEYREFCSKRYLTCTFNDTPRPPSNRIWIKVNNIPKSL